MLRRDTVARTPPGETPVIFLPPANALLQAPDP